MFIRPRTSVSPGAQARKISGWPNFGIAGQSEAPARIGEGLASAAGS